MIIYDLQNEGMANIKVTVKKTALNTIKSPMVLSIIGAVILNLIRTFTIKDAAIPIYISEMFQQFGTMISSIGIMSIGLFMR